jgi:hypothetical protein
VPLIVHGRTVYLSQFHAAADSIAMWGGLALFFVAGLIDFYKDPYQWRRKPYVTQ